jgi:hypothetical protein
MTSLAHSTTSKETFVKRFQNSYGHVTTCIFSNMEHRRPLVFWTPLAPQGLRCVPTTYDHHLCVNNTFIAESARPLTTGSLSKQ